MKQLFAFVSILLFSCNTDKLKSFIPGTFTRHYVDEYTDSYDTLKIAFITEDGSNGYSLTKSMKYKKRWEGRLLPEQYRVQEWTGKYNETSKTLFIEQTGNQIYFDPLRNELKMGTLPYKKSPIKTESEKESYHIDSIIARHTNANCGKGTRPRF